MMQYTFWYGSCDAADLEWLDGAIQSLKVDEWKPDTPLFFDGTGWADPVRENAALQLLEALRENKSAKTLSLRNANLDLKGQAALDAVFQRIAPLLSVSLRNIRYQGQPTALPVSLFANNAVRELNLEQTVLSKAASTALGDLVRSSKCLRSLTLSNVKMQGGVDGGLDALRQSVKDSQSLDHFQLCSLDQQQGPSDEIESLLSAIAENQSLTVVKLEKMDLDESHARMLAHILRVNKSLARLSLRSNELDGEAIKILMQDGLLHNQTLEKLYLSHNPVGDDGAIHVVQALEQNTNLRHLCLVHCEIWRDGCLALATGLARFSGLVVLDADMNELEECGPEILSSLEQNMRLEHVLGGLPRLMENKGDGSLWKQVDFYLRANKMHRRSLLHDASVKSRLVPRILQQASAQPDVLFHFLQLIPTHFDKRD